MNISDKKQTNKVFLCVAVILISLIEVSCMGEVKKKLKTAKQGVSNVTTIAKNAQEAKKDIENLKDAVPLTNEELKTWLPESLDGWQRSGFKVGTTGYMNVASIEGTYKIEEQEEPSETTQKKLTINIIDGAGQSGSIMIAGLGMASKMDMEEETEHKHTKSVTVNGIRAQQTFHKKRNETALQFVFDKRFGVMVNGLNLEPDETWQMVEKIDLAELIDLAE